MINYYNCVTKYSKQFKEVLIDKEYLDKITEFAKLIIDRKKTEHHHLLDCNQELKRFTTGLMGEAALEKLLGIKIIDWTIGDSANHHHPDIPNYKVGIKTVETGKFPIIFKKNWYSQIICIRSDKIDNLVIICGLATPSVLNEFQSDELIIDPNLRKRGTKTGFWGFHQLRPITRIEDLASYKK